MAGIHSLSKALDAVRALAEAAANQRDTSLVGSDLRLFEGIRTIATNNTESSISPFSLGRTYELLLSPTARRKTGSHLTPEAVARGLVAMMPKPEPSDRVLDPAVGGAAFLLAAADELVGVGADPEAVLGQLMGIDIDGGALAVAEAAVALWGLDHGVEVRALPALRHGDGLLDDLPAVERVVGNPPFLTQLRSSSSHTAARRKALRSRWGDLIEAYTDDAWLFLAGGLQALEPGGAIAMVQPVSILAARHGEAIRHFVHDNGEMTGLWVAIDRVFDAAVQVCGVVLRSAAESDPATRVRRSIGVGFSEVESTGVQPTPHEWGRVAATATGIPEVRLETAVGTVADMATATAGFRDQFYGFVPYVGEAVENESPRARLITVGMIDVLGLSWGDRDFKFAKRNVRRPVIDLDALRKGDPSLGQWCDDRLRPKLLMATQTRVVEVWVDERGTSLPATPVVSIEPHDEDPDTLWLLAAALSAPAVTAHFLSAKFGTAMSLNSMKLAARDVLETPLPKDHDAWRAAAAVIRAETPDLEDFAGLMGQAYGQSHAELQAWWLGRAGVGANT